MRCTLYAPQNVLWPNHVQFKHRTIQSTFARSLDDLRWFQSIFCLELFPQLVLENSTTLPIVIPTSHTISISINPLVREWYGFSWCQWLFLVPLIGGRWYITTQLAVYRPVIYHLYIANWVIICYWSHLLREPGVHSIDYVVTPPQRPFISPIRPPLKSPTSSNRPRQRWMYFTCVVP